MNDYSWSTYNISEQTENNIDSLIRYTCTITHRLFNDEKKTVRVGEAHRSPESKANVVKIV